MLLNKEKVNRSIFFMIWPAGSFIYSLFHIKSADSRLIIILFYGLCGFFYPFSFSDNIDVVRHADRFQLVASLPFEDFFTRVATLYTSDTNKPDIVQPLIEFVVSRFTSDFRIYFAVLGLLFGLVLMHFLKFILADDVNKRHGIIYFSLVLFIIILMPPYRIAGFRQMGGAILFCLGVYQVLIHNDKRFHIAVAGSCLVHFGFIILMPFYLLYFIVGNRYWIYFILIVVAFLVRNQAPSFIGDIGSDFQGQFSQRVQAYTDDRYLEHVAEVKEAQLGIISNQLPFTAYFFFILLLYFFSRGIIQKENGNAKIYSMILSLFIFLTFITNLHNTLVRFSVPLILLSSTLTLRLMNSGKPSYYLARLFLFFVIGINGVVMVRKAIEFTGVQVIVPNLFLAFFLDTQASILDLIK